LELQLFSDSFSAKLQALTTWMNSLSTSLTSAGQQLDKRLGISPTQIPLTNSIFNTISSGRVHCNRFHLQKLLGLPLPPPKTSRFNLPRHRLHNSTLVYHRPRAPNDHPKPLFLCGSRHQPQAPDQPFGLLLMETLNIDDDDYAPACDVIKLVCFELMTAFDTVSVLLFSLPLGLISSTIS